MPVVTACRYKCCVSKCWLTSLSACWVLRHLQGLANPFPNVLSAFLCSGSRVMYKSSTTPASSLTNSSNTGEHHWCLKLKAMNVAPGIKVDLNRRIWCMIWIEFRDHSIEKLTLSIAHDKTSPSPATIISPTLSDYKVPLKKGFHIQIPFTHNIPEETSFL